MRPRCSKASIHSSQGCATPLEHDIGADDESRCGGEVARDRLTRTATVWVGMPSLPKKNATRKQPSRPSDLILSAAFETYPRLIRTKLLALRKLILGTAKAIDGVGTLEEAIKWGQVSFLTSETGSGTTIRIDWVKSEPDRYALYVHCQTNLIETFREIYPELNYGGNRCILLDATEGAPTDALRHCVGLALTYHRDKNRHERMTGRSQFSGQRVPRSTKAKRAS